MQILNSTEPHYIRCIKPNADCQAMTFRKEEVLSQLQACGIVEAITISAAGFPIRISFQSFTDRYEILRKSRRSSKNNACDKSNYHTAKKKACLDSAASSAYYKLLYAILFSKQERGWTLKYIIQSTR